jgi:mono/diheme cytochrome c family protein
VSGRSALRVALGAVALVAIVLIVVLTRHVEHPAAVPTATERDKAQIARGAYLARAGDCVSCHTGRGSPPYSGGLALKTPFGTFYPPNITPDNETGLGQWSADDFWTALHEGRSRNGDLLYPAFPYDSYTLVTREDADAIFAFLKSLPAVNAPRRAHALEFPYNERQLLIGWRTLYFKPLEFKQDMSKNGEWNRGAYLVQGLGHCSGCHSERNALGAIDPQNPVSGGVLPTTNWYAPALTSNPETGLGSWSVDDIAALLKSGVSHRAAIYGPMAEVVVNSLQYLSDEDVRSIAVYLKTEGGTISGKQEDFMTESEITDLMQLGAKIYDTRCKTCHGAEGAGQPPAYPPLAGNGSVVTRTAINPIRLVLHGGFPPSTTDNPRPYGMPPFAYSLSEREMASVVTYIRRSWGNQASAVAPGDVEKARTLDPE